MWSESLVLEAFFDSFRVNSFDCDLYAVIILMPVSTHCLPTGSCEIYSNCKILDVIVLPMCEVNIYLFFSSSLEASNKTTRQ